VLNATTLDSIAAWPSGLFPNRLHLTLDGKLVLQSNAQSSTVSVYDARTRALIGNIDFAYDESRAKPTMLTQFGRSATPLGILIAPDGKRAWVALAAMDEIADVDIATRKVVRLPRPGASRTGWRTCRKRPCAATTPCVVRGRETLATEVAFRTPLPAKRYGLRNLSARTNV
jgi:DNA-binding beta-propeller fold protein YncE